MLNVKSRTIFCRDNLDILEGINSDCIDLIYLDPPFNTNEEYVSPIESSAQGAGFKDIFRKEDIKDEWVKSIEFENPKLFQYLCGVKQFSSEMNYCYLVYMAIRLIECHRVLKDTGSLYLHCDQTMSHYLKIVLDMTFGEKSFKNEIIWHYFKPHGGKVNYPKNYDNIFFYTKGDKYIFNYKETFFKYDEKSVKRYNKTDEEGQKFKTYHDKNGVVRKAYLKEGKSDNVFKIPFIQGIADEKTGYRTQKPLALMERIIKTSSNEGDMVLDPFCGCATTCVAAEKLGREWIGIDVGAKAFDFIRARLDKEVPTDIFRKEPNFLTDPPKPTDTTTVDRDSGYIYIISNPAFPDIYKVGIARDVTQRLNSYQTSDPDRAYKLEYSLKTKKYREIEKYIHANFDNRHEWVHATKIAIVAAIKKANEE